MSNCRSVRIKKGVLGLVQSVEAGDSDDVLHLKMYSNYDAEYIVHASAVELIRSKPTTT